MTKYTSLNGHITQKNKKPTVNYIRTLKLKVKHSASMLNVQKVNYRCKDK